MRYGNGVWMGVSCCWFWYIGLFLTVNFLTNTWTSLRVIQLKHDEWRQTYVILSSLDTGVHTNNFHGTKKKKQNSNTTLKFLYVNTLQIGGLLLTLLVLFQKSSFLNVVCDDNLPICFQNQPNVLVSKYLIAGWIFFWDMDFMQTCKYSIV